jgi:hypothetical protein
MRILFANNKCEDYHKKLMGWETWGLSFPTYLLEMRISFRFNRVLMTNYTALRTHLNAVSSLNVITVHHPEELTGHVIFWLFSLILKDSRQLAINYHRHIINI